MPLGASALPPAEYVDFCQRQPWDCGAEPQAVLAGVARAKAERAALFAAADPTGTGALLVAAPAAVPAPASPALALSPARRRDAASAPIVPRMSPQLWSRLNRVNNQVNHAVRQATDMATYGKIDYWATPIEDEVGSGDCEDAVLQKQRTLIAAGLAREALNIAVVVTPRGETHAVLLVNTSEGEFVLDNLSPWVTPWRMTGYRWRQRQVDGGPFKWVMVQDPARGSMPPQDRFRSPRFAVATARPPWPHSRPGPAGGEPSRVMAAVNATASLSLPRQGLYQPPPCDMAVAGAFANAARNAGCTRDQLPGATVFAAAASGRHIMIARHPPLTFARFQADQQRLGLPHFTRTMSDLK